jgi:hypothetical protein
MREYPADPRVQLIEMSDFERDPLPELLRENETALRQVVTWAREYLCKPHPELGRTGPVCPFVNKSMRKQYLFFAVYRGADLDRADVCDVVMKYRDWFLEMEPREGRDAQLKSINILFPDVSPEEAPLLIDVTQAELKPQYVEKGIMVGEFHPGPPKKAGLWNPDFRPLWCPVPMLSIRHMVSTDFAFLNDEPELLIAYLKAFEGNVPPHLQESVEQAARRLGIIVDPAVELVEPGAAPELSAAGEGVRSPAAQPGAPPAS